MWDSELAEDPAEDGRVALLLLVDSLDKHLRVDVVLGEHVPYVHDGNFRNIGATQQVVEFILQSTVVVLEVVENIGVDFDGAEVDFVLHGIAFQ